MVILENIDIAIDIDKAILQNIDIDKISNRFKFGISNRASGVPKWKNMRYVSCCTFPISQNKSAEWGKQLRRAEKPRPRTAML